MGEMADLELERYYDQMDYSMYGDDRFESLESNMFNRLNRKTPKWRSNNCTYKVRDMTDEHLRCAHNWCLEKRFEECAEILKKEIDKRVADGFEDL